MEFAATLGKGRGRPEYSMRRAHIHARGGHLHRVHIRVVELVGHEVFISFILHIGVVEVVVLHMGDSGCVDAPWEVAHR